MAGIGFHLKKKLLPGTLTSVMQGYGYAALISSGPWIISILSLALLGLVLSTGGFTKDLALFFVVITHIYGFSLILTGPIQMVMTRFAADRHYRDEEEKVFPALITCLAFVSSISGILGLIVFIGLMPANFIFQLSSAFFLVVLSCIWITSVFLTSLKNYNAVLISFAIGYGLSFLFAWMLSKLWGPQYAILGYVIGQVVLLLLFLKAVWGKFGNQDVANFDFLPYFKSHWPLALVGLFYNVGMWIDKLIYWWFSPLSMKISGLFYAAPTYDAAVYLSFLSVVPGMAVFLIKLETDYAENYESFFNTVLKKKTLSEIESAKERMVRALREGLKQQVKVQALVTGCLILFAHDILAGLQLGAVQTGIFQMTLLGVFMMVVFLSLLTVLFYLDQIRDAMLCCICFTAANVLLTSWNVAAGERWYGTGFVGAAATALLLAAVFVNRRHRLLEYNTFAPQKIVAPSTPS